MLNCRLFLSSNDFPRHVFRGSVPEGPSGVEAMDESVLMDEILVASPEELRKILDSLSLDELSRLNERINESLDKQQDLMGENQTELLDTLRNAFLVKQLTEGSQGIEAFRAQIDAMDPQEYYDFYYQLLIQSKNGSDFATDNALWMLDHALEHGEDWALREKYQNLLDLRFDKDLQRELVYSGKENLQEISSALDYHGRGDEMRWDVNRMFEAQDNPKLQEIYLLDYNAVFQSLYSLKAHLDSSNYNQEELDYFARVASRHHTDRMKNGTASDIARAFRDGIKEEGPAWRPSVD